MHIPFTSLRNYLLIGASLALGAITTTWIDREQPQEEMQPEVEAQAAGQFVQEPAQRTSLKPFSRDSSIRLSNKRGNFLMLRAFQDAIGGSWKSAAQLLSGGRQIGLGAIVDSEGWICTKASLLPRGDVEVRLYDNREYPAEVVATVVEHDIALLRITATNLPAVQWADRVPNSGSWLATIDLKTVPRSVGVVSAGVQSVSKSNPVLGVHLIDSREGAAVTHVLEGTGAQVAGLKVDDAIYEVNGVEVYTLQAFRRAIGTAVGGELVHLAVKRGEENFEVDARLMDLSDELLDETEMEVNGRISARATGFSKVFLHDTVLEPHQCGGPVVNLDGKVVGINIARAGRVTSYALPTEVVQPVVNELIENARLVSKTSEQKTEVRAVR